MLHPPKRGGRAYPLLYVKVDKSHAQAAAFVALAEAEHRARSGGTELSGTDMPSLEAVWLMVADPGEAFLREVELYRSLGVVTDSANHDQHARVLEQVRAYDILLRDQT